MRYTALPPALVRGVVRVAHTGTGGSSSPTYLSQKRTRNKDGKYRKIILFNALQPGIRTPPATSVRTGGTPLVNAGGKASIHSRTVTARQIPNLSGNRGLCLQGTTRVCRGGHAVSFLCHRVFYSLGRPRISSTWGVSVYNRSREAYPQSLSKVNSPQTSTSDP